MLRNGKRVRLSDDEIKEWIDAESLSQSEVVALINSHTIENDGLTEGDVIALIESNASVEHFTTTADQVHFSDLTSTLCVKGADNESKFHILDSDSQILLNADTSNNTIRVRNLETIGSSFFSVDIGTGPKTNDTNNTGAISIGHEAGTDNQQTFGIAIGVGSGHLSQGIQSVAVGIHAGNTNQASECVAIGGFAGEEYSETGCVSIGYRAGQNRSGRNSICIGKAAGQASSGATSIILNATGTSLNSNTPGLFVAPIRTGSQTNPNLSYDTITKEIGYYTPAAAVPDSSGTWTHGVIATSIYISYATPDPGSGFKGDSHRVFSRAVAALPQGGTIYVGAGTYIFTGSVTFNAITVNIIGTGNSTLHAGVSDIMFKMVSDYTQVTFQSLKVSLPIESTFLSTYGGLNLNSYVTIRQTHFKFGLVAAVLISAELIDGGIGGIYIMDSIINTSTVTTNVRIFDSSQNLNRNLNITNCKFQGNWLALHSFAAGGDADQPVFISNCSFNGWDLIGVRDVLNLQVSDCTFYNSRIRITPTETSIGTRLSLKGCTMISPNRLGGKHIYIHVGSSAPALVTSIDITGCSMDPALIGIYLQATAAGITNTLKLRYIANLDDVSLEQQAGAGQWIQDPSNIVEYPSKDRTFASLPLVNVPYKATCVTTDAGLVRWNGTTWTRNYDLIYLQTEWATQPSAGAKGTMYATVERANKAVTIFISAMNSWVETSDLLSTSGNIPVGFRPISTVLFPFIYLEGTTPKVGMGTLDTSGSIVYQGINVTFTINVMLLIPSHTISFLVP